MTSIFDVPGTNPPNTFTPVIEQYLAKSSTSPTTAIDIATATAKAVVDHVTTSPKPGNALYNLWDAFFNSVVHAPLVKNNANLSFQHHLTLLSAIGAHPPTRPAHPAVKPGSFREEGLLASGHLQRDDRGSFFDWSKLPLFPAQWRDTHDILESWRSWDGIRRDRDGQPIGTAAETQAATRTPAEYHTRFVTFSALLVQHQYEARQTARDGHANDDADKEVIHPIWVFYAARGTLETDHPGGQRPGDGEDRKVTTEEGHLAPEKLWNLDVKTAAIWLRCGARALWETDAESLREHYARTLDWQTALWKGDGDIGRGGISRARWRLWADRLRSLMEGKVNPHYELDRETREEAEEARRVVEDLLLDKEL